MNQTHEKLAEWAGLECRCEYYEEKTWDDTHTNRYWGNCPRHSNGGEPPDYDRDEVAIRLLLSLSHKHGWTMYYSADDNKYGCGIDGRYYSGDQPTIAAAITKAITLLIEAENGKQ